MEYTFDDGGRALAGHKGLAGDCTVRAIAIATEQPYQRVYDALFDLNRNTPKRGPRKSSPRDGNTRMATIKEYMAGLGWKWKACVSIGSGCKVHLRAEELPGGRIVTRLSKHLCAVIDGVIHDSYDPQRDGTRCVYGYWSKE